VRYILGRQCSALYVPIILSIFVHMYFCLFLICKYYFKVFDTAILFISYTIQGGGTDCTYIEHKYMAHIAM
jgi:hypothetical protein